MTSFYVGPGKPRLNASTWSDLEATVIAGLAHESQWCELKLGLPPSSDASNLELARDLASLTVDGGVLVVGVRDKASIATDVVGIAQADVDGVRSRIDQVAGARVFPAMHPVIHTIEKPDGSGRSVLVVEVSPSPSAPHRAGDVYWGRSATGKRPLSDADIQRLMMARAESANQFKTRLLAMGEDADPVTPESRIRGRLYLLARPVVLPAMKLSDALANVRILELILAAIRHVPERHWADLQRLHYDVAHADGRAGASDEPSMWGPDREQFFMYVMLRDDATIQFVSGELIGPFGDGGADAIWLAAAVEIVHQIAALTVHLSAEYLQYSGDWRVGVHLTGLKGLLPSHAYHSATNTRQFAPYPSDTYTRDGVFSADQLADPSSAMAEALLGDIARGLGLGRQPFPYTDLAELYRKMRA